MEKIRVEREDEITNLYLGEEKILSDLSFRLGWGKGIPTKDCKFVGERIEKGKDEVGSFVRKIFRYEYFGSEIRFVFRIYDRFHALYVGIENELPESKFSHLTGEISIGGVPDFKRGSCCSNSWEAMARIPSTYAELGALAGILAEYLTFFLRQPLTLARYVSLHFMNKDTKYACWTYPKFFRTMENIPMHTLFLVLEAKHPLVFLPMSAYGQKSSLVHEGRRLKLKIWGFDTTKLYSRMPGVVITIGNPYSATPFAFEVLKAVSEGKISLRGDRGEAKVLGKLGWCSWNAFYRGVSGEGVLETIESMLDKRIPIKFVIIDDGWQRSGSRMLTSLNPNEKFDMKKIVGELKEKLGVEYVGLWHALQGYWMGVHPKSGLAKLTFKGSDGRHIPLEKEFFERWYGEMARWGVDFVKVDNQFDILPSFFDRIPIEGAASKLLQNLHAAAHGKLKTILNCMGVVPECYYNTKAPVHRCSADYSPCSKERAKKHLISCAYSSFWMSNLGTPDYDMFKTHDPYAKPHAIARAINGGPIYLTDEPNKSDTRIARMLCLNDGEIPKPDFPALVSPDSFFDDPYTTTKPLKLFTRVGKIGLVAAFNLNKEGKTEKAVITSEDAMLPGDEYSLYSVCRREMTEGKAVTNLRELEAEVFVISPIRMGFAPIGIEGMFVPPGGIRILRFSPFACEVKKEGTFVGYSRDKRAMVKIGGRRATPEVRGKCLRLHVRKNGSVAIK